MAEKKISELTAITSSELDDDDNLIIVDTSESQTKKISKSELASALAGGGDSSTLEGQDGAYYLNYNNHTNTPTIPTAVSDLTNDSGFITSVPAQSFASLTGKPTTISGYGITDAFDGAYGSLTGTPTIPTNNNQLTNGAGYITSADIVGDTTPQLGGNLDLNSNNITGTGDIDITGTVTADGLTVDTTTLHVDATNNSVGIGTISPEGNMHIFNSSSGTVTAPTDANELVLESTANVGMSFLTANSSIARIKFGDPDATNAGVIAYNHSDDSLRFNVNGAERTRIDSSGNVGIGTSSPSTKFHVQQAATTLPTIAADAVGILSSNGTTALSLISGTGNSVLRFADSSDENVGQISYAHALDDMIFTVNASEAMRILSSGGITFNGDTADANALDFYEEGIFIPTLDTNSGNAATASAVAGSYTRIGRLVHINVKINNIDTTGTTASSVFRIENLPFIHSGSDNFHMSCRFNFLTHQGNRTQVTALVNSSEQIIFSAFGADGASTNVDHADLGDDTADVFVTGTYHTAT